MGFYNVREVLSLTLLIQLAQHQPCFQLRFFFFQVEDSWKPSLILISPYHESIVKDNVKMNIPLEACQHMSLIENNIYLHKLPKFDHH
jgi:hypothetical protein